MLFDVPFIADWKQIGENRQRMTDCNNNNKNKKPVDYDYKVGDKIRIRKDGILRKTESIWDKELLELSRTGMYVTYPYLESHESREPVSH